MNMGDYALEKSNDLSKKLTMLSNEKTRSDTQSMGFTQ